MSEGDLFSAGFAWGDVADAATPVATPDKGAPSQPRPPLSQTRATPVATGDAPAFARDFGWSDDAVASVAGVANLGVEAEVSQNATPPIATEFATRESAHFRGLEGQSTQPVADVASVANWSLAVERAARSRAPDGITDMAWRALVMDARMLLQNWGTDLFGLGWTTLEIFGVARQPGMRRLDVVGLVYLLRGNAVEAIDRDTALIRVTPRDTLTFQRKLVAGGGVPLWKWVEASQGGAVGMAGGGSAFSAYPRHPRHVNPDQGAG